MSTTKSTSRASPRQREEQRQLAEARALEARIRAFNGPKQAPSATWAPEGTPDERPEGARPTKDDRRPASRNKSPTTWSEARTEMSTPNDKASRQCSPPRNTKSTEHTTPHSATSTTAPPTTGTGLPDIGSITRTLPFSRWEKDRSQNLSLSYSPDQSTQETILVRPPETATGLSEMDSPPPNQLRSASEESRAATGKQRRNRYKKSTPSGLRRTQRREHLQQGTGEVNQSGAANGGRQGERTEKSVSNWPSYDKQDEEFNLMLSGCPKGQTETGRGMGTTEGKEQDIQVPEMRVHGKRCEIIGILGTNVYRTFPMTERSIYLAFLFPALFEMFTVEFYATILMLANYLGQRPKLENGGRRILILFGTLLCLPKIQALPFETLDGTMAPPGWATAAAAVVAAQTAVTVWRRWKYANPTPATITQNYAQNMRDQGDNLQSQLETLINQQNTSNQELDEGLTRYNALVATHNQMAEQANTSQEELVLRKRELAEALEKLKEFQKQVTGNMEEIKKTQEQLRQAQETVKQLTDAAKEGNDSSQTIVKLQEELAQNKREGAERLIQEIVKFSQQLANQSTNTMNVIIQLMEKLGSGKNKADKCGCTLNGKEPDKFDGKDPEKFLAWFTRVENYVGGQLHRIATAKDVRIILFSMLEEDALEYAIESCPEGHSDPAIMGEDEETLKTAEYNTIMDWLSEQFKDSLMTQKLVTEWEKCYQNDEKFQTWIIRYERIVKKIWAGSPSKSPNRDRGIP
ncbi:hypothetical protein BDD12DRAFT_805415 [Trichophaea hybrida]|nr:hypothetical protein BDD12DRAFT_805415 [Trichophaea hybrida]